MEAAAKKKKRRAGTALEPMAVDLPADAARPRLVVFDLDNTLWTPELYELGRKVVAEKDVRLNQGAVDALWDLAVNRWPNTEGAVASRTDRTELAESLLHDFRVAPGASAASVLPHRQIFPGSKRRHFQNLQKSTGVAFSEMLFFDDWTVNLGEVAQLGVLGVHTPRGLTRDLWTGGLRAYALLKSQNTDFMGRMFTPADLRELQH